MRKIIPLLVVGILVLSGLGAVAVTEGEKENIVSKTINFSQPKIVENENFVSIDISEANSNYWETGKPLMPVVSEVFEFELGTRIDSVEVTFSNPVTQKLSKLIKPTPEAQVRSMVQSTKSINKPSEVSYSELGVYPQERFSYTTSAGKVGLDNMIICSVSLNPVQYNTRENTITYSQHADIKIKYTSPANPINFPDEYDLLIITPTEFESTLQRFINHKEGRNIRVKLVTLDDIPSGVGIDEQEDIKYFVKDAIETWSVDYLIIVGSGVEGNEKFPVRLVYNDGEYFPSDLYYADVFNATMEFPDWDYDEDEIYGEYPRDKPDMDVIPDIHLGKIPCHTVSELNAYIDKVIWYDEHNLMTKKICQIGGDTFPGDNEGIMEGEYANAEVLTKLPGYTSFKYWASLDELTKPNFADGFNKVLPDFYDLSGHGNIESWATHPPEDEDTWIPGPTTISPYGGITNREFDVYRIKNPKKYPIIFYNACSNNKFTKSEECLSWKTLKIPEGGAIIAFGASGLGMGSQGSDETKRLFGWMEVHTHEELYNTKNLGQVWSNSITDYYTTFSSGLKKYDYKTMIEYSMFGDPTLNAENGDDPIARSQPRPIINIFEKLQDYFPRLAKLFQLILAKLS